MSIERMESIVLLAPSSDREKFIEWLYEERQVHLEEFRDTSEEWADRFHPEVEDPSDAEFQISKLQGSIEFLREIHKTPGDFIEGLFPVRILATRNEIEGALKEVDPDTLFRECGRLRDAIENARSECDRLDTEQDRIHELDFLKVRLDSLRGLRHTVFRLVAASGQAQYAFNQDERLTGNFLVERMAGLEPSVIFLIAAPISESGVIDEIVNDYSLREIPLPSRNNTVAEELESLKREFDRARTHESDIRNEAIELSKKSAHNADLVLAWWESERLRMLQKSSMVGSRNVFAARGYIRANELPAFRERLSREFPGTEIEVMEAPAAEETPVSMSWNHFFRPAGLLVKMFGLPSYRSIDPTKFLTLTFLIFFGICYGDLLYGIMLIMLAAWLKKRFRGQRGLVEFFRLFTYAGVSTVIFGIAMGSWAADLTKYFGEGNPVDLLRQKLTLLDPLAKPVVALGIAIGIGVTNQLYGIFMRFLRDFRRGDIASSVFDGVFWISYLISLLVLSVGLILSAPKAVVFTAGGIFAASALGLILTQGREHKSWPARIFTGTISLYGIMGTYGTTAFVGDVISYSRLMALGLTTSVVGMSFNIIAGMVKGIPYVGWVFFAMVVVFGHVFNFTMSIMSAFVHSARLILLEWFSRFYEGGGAAFRPFGFQSSHLDIVEEPVKL